MSIRIILTLPKNTTKNLKIEDHQKLDEDETFDIVQALG